MKKKKSTKELPWGSLSIIVPFPKKKPIKSFELLTQLQSPVFAGVPEGNKFDFPQASQYLSLHQLENDYWQISDSSTVNTDWVLFLEEDEFLEKNCLSLMLDILPKVCRTEHSLSVNRNLTMNDLKQLDWINTRKVYSTPTANMTGYHAIELRLIPTELLAKLVLRSSSDGDLSPSFHLSLSQNSDSNVVRNFLPLTISRKSPSYEDNHLMQPGDREIFLRGHGNFFGDKQFLEEFEWPRTMYVLIRKDHTPAILQGLKEGIAPRSIVMFTINYLIRMGEFELALEFLSALPKHWEIRDDLVISQMKLILYFAVGDFTSARQVLEKCRDKAEEDPLFLENMGKFYLLLGEKKEAAGFFRKSLDKTSESEDRSHLKNFLETLNDESERWPTMTACIICQDEEENLPKALKSVIGLADEIIVVDTGSCDGSKNIAHQFGARVFDLPWNKDFSEARNFALQQATSDYVLILDADEYLYAANFVDFQVMKRLLPLKELSAFILSVGHLKIETDWMNVRGSSGNFIKEVEAFRIFPRLPDILYKGRVEESLSESLAKLNIPILILPESQVRIHHGILDREKRVARKLSIYEEVEAPGLNETLAAVRDFSYLNYKTETIKWLMRLIDLLPEEKESPFSGMGIRLALLLEEDSPKEAGKVLEKMVRIFPEDQKIRISLCSYLIRHGDFEELGKMSFNQHPLPTRPLNSSEMEYLIYSGLATLESGNVNDAAWLLDQVLSQQPLYLLGQTARFYLLSRIGDIPAATQALEDVFVIVRSHPIIRINTPLEFFKTVELLSEILEKWGHPVERTLLLHGALSLRETSD